MKEQVDAGRRSREIEESTLVGSKPDFEGLTS